MGDLGCVVVTQDAVTGQVKETTNSATSTEQARKSTQLEVVEQLE
jgi:hypothetical protein